MADNTNNSEKEETMNPGLTIEAVRKETGISFRNIKYWTALYELPFQKKGRRNYYPPDTVELLRAIALLSRFHVFSSRYIRWLIDLKLERPLKEESSYIAFLAEEPFLVSLFGIHAPRSPSTTVPQHSSSSSSSFSPSFSAKGDHVHNNPSDSSFPTAFSRTVSPDDDVIL
ncbi:MAG: MerR family transcriptional regulator [Candidatus Hydrogenedentota bacterium]|nr:MAG: MerR family transcriptional regulator [Candidatus Hydrogenedentota bacterium]